MLIQGAQLAEIKLTEMASVPIAISKQLQ